MILRCAQLADWEDIWPRGSTAHGQEKVALARSVKGWAYDSLKKVRMHSESTYNIRSIDLVTRLRQRPANRNCLSIGPIEKVSNGLGNRRLQQHSR
jgi:hypothetical protein